MFREAGAGTVLPEERGANQEPGSDRVLAVGNPCSHERGRLCHMKVWSSTSEVPHDLAATSVTVGSFDGVHLGHRVLLDRVVADQELGLLPVAVTFWPHPMARLRPMEAPLLLSTEAARLELLAGAGLFGVLQLPFTDEMAAMSAERFATVILANTLHARHVVVGKNFRFGHRASGDVTLLRELGRELGYQVTVVELATLPDQAPVSSSAVSSSAVSSTAVSSTVVLSSAVSLSAVSSTAVRAMVASGEVAAAAAALGRWHRVSGPVEHGDHRGRLLGFPTANVAVPDAYAVPADGVYAGWLRSADEPGLWRPAAISIGTNPTFEGRARRVEAYAIDAPADLDLYDQIVDLDFVERLREIKKFDSVADLIASMHADVARAAGLLANNAAAPNGSGPS